MNLKTLSLASAIALFATSPILAQQTKPEGKPNSDPQSAATPGRLPLEIKGDRIGETVAQFTAHYPNAECEDQSPDVRKCYQRDGVSLASLTDMGNTCHPPTTPYWQNVCGMLGLSATFEKDRLTFLTYVFWVNGAANDAQLSTQATCDAFALKYGKPDSSAGRDGCVWLRKNKGGETEQALIIRTDNMKVGGGVAVLTVVSLGNALPSKDV